MRADISIDEDQKLIRRTVTGQLTPERSLRIIYEMATMTPRLPDEVIAGACPCRPADNRQGAGAAPHRP